MKKIIIFPHTPQGGRQENKPKEINSKARLLFEQHFRETFGADYYWTAKDAGAMSQLLNKLKFQREQKENGRFR